MLAMNLLLLIQRYLRLMIACSILIRPTGLILPAILLIVIVMHRTIGLTMHGLVIPLYVIDLLMSWMQQLMVMSWPDAPLSLVLTHRQHRRNISLDSILSRTILLMFATLRVVYIT